MIDPLKFYEIELIAIKKRAEMKQRKYGEQKTCQKRSFFDYMRLHGCLKIGIVLFFERKNRNDKFT